MGIFANLIQTLTSEIGDSIQNHAGALGAAPVGAVACGERSLPQILLANG